MGLSIETTGAATTQTTTDKHIEVVVENAYGPSEIPLSDFFRKHVLSMLATIFIPVLSGVLILLAILLLVKLYKERHHRNAFRFAQTLNVEMLNDIPTPESRQQLISAVDSEPQA